MSVRGACSWVRKMCCRVWGLSRPTSRYRARTKPLCCSYWSPSLTWVGRTRSCCCFSRLRRWSPPRGKERSDTRAHARTRRMGISKLQTPWALSFSLRPPFPCPTSSRAAWRVRVLCRGGEGGISVVLGVDFVGRVVIRLQVVSPKVLSGNHRTEAATCLLYCLHFGGVRRIWRAGYCLGILRAIVDMEYPRFYESELGPIIWQRHDQLVRPDISATVCWL